MELGKFKFVAEWCKGEGWKLFQLMLFSFEFDNIIVIFDITFLKFNIYFRYKKWDGLFD